MWLLTHDKILTNGSHWRRHLTSNPCWNRCDAEVEDGVHAVRDCKESKEVLKCIIPPPLRQSFFMLGLQEWLLMNSKYRGEDIDGIGRPEMTTLIYWSA